MGDLIDFIYLRGDACVSEPPDQLRRHLCCARTNALLDGGCSIPERL